MRCNQLERLLAAFSVLVVMTGCAHVEPKAAPSPLPSPPAAEAPSPAPPADRAPHINQAGLAIIKESEGLHLAAYQDSGQWLIGYGHADGAKQGKTISRETAEAYLIQDLALCESKVSQALIRPASPNEFSAMVSLCYNIGWQPFAASTLVKHFNAGGKAAAADAFLNWSKATVDGRKTVLPRLADRRKRERALFLSKDMTG